MRYLKYFENKSKYNTYFNSLTNIEDKENLLSSMDDTNDVYQQSPFTISMTISLSSLTNTNCKVNGNFVTFTSTDEKYVYNYKTYDKVTSINFAESDAIHDIVSIPNLPNTITSLNGLFNKRSDLYAIECSNWDTSHVTNMSEVFCYLSNLSKLDISGWNTSNVTNMHYLFDTCNISSIDVSQWNTSKVTDMSGAFSDLYNIKSIDLKRWDTKNVTTLTGLFHACKVLEYADLSTWQTPKLTSMRAMFQNCSQIVKIDLSNFDTSKVTDMYYLFGECSKLESLDLSNFTVNGSGANFESLFYGCSSLNYIKCKQAFKDWCWANQDKLYLPTAMRNGGSGKWDIV